MSASSEQQPLLAEDDSPNSKKTVDFQNTSFEGAGNGTRGASRSNTGATHNGKPPVNIKATNVFIYFSHFLTKWGERMWMFAVGLFLIYISPNSLQLTAIYGLSTGITVLLFGPVVGDWVDNTQRLKAARATLILQTLFVVLCSVVIYVFIKLNDELLSIGGWVRYAFYAVIILLAAASVLASTANTITVERDWIVEMCDGDEEKLATMTARMKGIDLSTQILAPIATGQIMAYIGTDSGAIFIAAWNIVTVVLEYYLIWKVYKTIPQLRIYKDTSKSVSSKNKSPAGKEEDGGNNSKASPTTDRRGCLKRCRILSAFLVIIEGWKTYARYDVMLSGLALACLFMTVLGFDTVTVGYAKIQGLNDSVIGLMMGGAGFIGILGTFGYPVFRKKLGLPRAGMVALLILLTCLSSCVISIWLPGSPFDPTWSNSDGDNSTNTVTDAPATDSSMVSVYVMMAGIISARFGLWVADLSISQMFMQAVKEEERGVVFGVQNSLNQMMNMVKFGLVTAMPLAPQFGFLIILSFSSILTGNIFYSAFLCRHRRTLFAPNPGKKSYSQI